MSNTNRQLRQSRHKCSSNARICKARIVQQERQCNSNARKGKAKTGFGVTPKNCKECLTQTGN
eukprot:4368754-Amphidinium_carterae.1